MQHTQALSKSRGISGAMSRMIHAVSEAFNDKSFLSDANKTSMELIKSMRESLDMMKNSSKLKDQSNKSQKKVRGVIPNVIHS